MNILRIIHHYPAVLTWTDTVLNDKQTMPNEAGLMFVFLLPIYIVRLIILIDDIFKGIVFSSWLTTNDIGILVSQTCKLFSLHTCH